ncbi:hypothetical protein O3M35_004279 [Rhynocoris fuscipes]|uniref:Uncharacterized protein n=1 Tax=Rhynocoris fuscipes TaxID=488301 RepID=A0AAW1CMT7_9HEMI
MRACSLPFNTATLALNRQFFNHNFVTNEHRNTKLVSFCPFYRELQYFCHNSK